MQIGRVVGLRCIPLQICLGPQSSGALLMSHGTDARRRPTCSNIIVCSSKTFNVALEPREFVFEENRIQNSTEKIRYRFRNISSGRFNKFRFRFCKTVTQTDHGCRITFWGCLRHKHSIYTGIGGAVTFWMHVLHA